MSALPEKIVTSYTPFHGTIIEMTYDPALEKSELVSNLQGGDKGSGNIDVPGKFRLLPLPPSDPFVRHDFVKFPSCVGQSEEPKELFEEIKTYIGKYVSLPDPFVNVAAAYVLMTWLYEKFHVIPYLRVIGSFGTGKTRFLEVIGNICYKATFAGGSASMASIFRTLNQVNGSLVFDEADFKASELWSEIIKLLNGGHMRGFPVIRMEKTTNGKMETKTFDVFGPKILASRQRYDDEALESRCLTQYLLPHKSLNMPIHLSAQFRSDALELRNKLLAFRFKYYATFTPKDDLVNKLEIPRMRQSVLAIANIAHLVGAEALKEVLTFAKKLEDQMQLTQSRTAESDVLICILELLHDESYLKQTKGKIRIGDIAMRFDRKFYSDFDDSDPYTHFSSIHYRVSARKIGATIDRKLNLKTERDSDGFFLPIRQASRIRALGDSFGITPDMLELPKSIRKQASKPSEEVEF